MTLWGRTAEIAGEYLSKGRGVHIEGYLKMDEWQDKTSGQKRTKLKVVADNMQMLGGRGDGDGGGGRRRVFRRRRGRQGGSTPAAGAAATSAATAAAAGAAQQSGGDDFGGGRTPAARPTTTTTTPRPTSTATTSRSERPKPACPAAVRPPVHAAPTSDAGGFAASPR